MSELTDSQRQHIIDLLEQGKEIPTDYKHSLFPSERQEYELVYANKAREEDILVETMTVPLQPVRTFGTIEADWRNMLIFGGNLQALRALQRDPKIVGQVKLVYIDPPFATQQDFRSDLQERAYQDKIAGSKFIEFLRKRLILLRELLHPQGAIFVHLDQRKSHYMKVILDEVFGEHNFRDEIIWRSTNSHSKSKTFGQIHQTILMYSRSSDLRFNKLKRPRFKQYEDENYRHSDTKGTYRLSDLTGEGTRAGASGLSWMGYDPTQRDRHWAIPSYVYTLVDDDISTLPLLEKLDYLLSVGLIVIPDKTGSQPAIKRYTGEDDGIFIQDIWSYQPYTEGVYNDTDECIDEDVTWALTKLERTGYPTQKPEGLLSRIIKSCTEQNDLVLDAFAGSGTTLAVAEKLGRRWIGIDTGKLSIYTIQKRMLHLRSALGNKGKPISAKAFTLFNAGLYDFSQLKQLPWQDWRFFALNLFECRDEPHKVHGVTLDGYRGVDDVLIFNHRQNGGVVLDYGFVDDLHTQIGSRLGSRFFIIAPAASVTFLEDYVDKGDTRYYILRIPYSIINELHNQDFETITQPIDEAQVNATVEAIGFDFISAPKLECEYSTREVGIEMFKEAIIKIKSFKSEALLKSITRKDDLEALSMVLVDYDYPYNPTRYGKESPSPFELDTVFYGNDIRMHGGEVRMLFDGLGAYVMIIYVDIYGNEYTEIKALAEFGGGPQQKASRSNRTTKTAAKKTRGAIDNA